MKKIITIAMIFIALNAAVGQNGFTLGPYYSLGASTILSSSNSMSMGSSMMGNNSGVNPDISFKLSFGAGLRAEMSLSEHWGLFLQTGFQQRGGIFTHYIDTYKPRYKLDYWDVNAGGQFKTKGIGQKDRFFVTLGLTQHTLIEANRVYDMGSDNISNSFRNIDFGSFLSIGENIAMFEKDIFQIQLFINQGFSQMFSGYMLMNNMHGRNLLIGVQIGYQIGKPKKIEIQK